MRRLVIACSALAAIVIAGSACFPQDQCTPFFVDYCGPNDTTCQGTIIDSTHWASGPINGTWLAYQPAETFLMHMRDSKTNATLSGEIYDYEGYIAAVQTPDTLGNSFSHDSGNLAGFTENTDNSSFFVQNQNCSSEYYYVVVTLLPGATIISPAGSEAGTNDGATE